MFSTRERTITVLKRWSGDGAPIGDFNVTLEDYWNQTKPTSHPSHSALPYYQPGAEDLINKLTAEFKKSKPYLVNITFKDLEPTNGSIKLIKQLIKATSQFPEAHFAPVAALLTPEAQEALVQDIMARLEPKLAAAIGGQTQSVLPAPKSAAKKAAAKKSASRRDGELE